MPMPAADAAIAQRRASYIHWIVQHFGRWEGDMSPADGRLWALQHARLVLGHDLEKANRYLAGFQLTRDSDICFIRFLKTLLDFDDSPRLSADARRHIVEVLTSWPVNDLTSRAAWPPIHTENHDLMQMTIGLFARQRRGEDLSEQVGQLLHSLIWRFQRGWVEWNSTCYQFHYSNPLILLAQHARDARLRRCAEDLLNVLLAERALLGVAGCLAGPSFRCRTADASNSATARKVAYLEDARYDAFLPTVWLAFGLGEARFDFDHARVAGLQPATTEYASANEPRLKQDEGIFFACSPLTPHPVVAALAAEASVREELVYAGQRNLGWPGPSLGETTWDTQRWMPGAIYYYNTPHISLGSIHSCGWICQSRYNKLVFAADPSQGLRVEMILPHVAPHKRRYEARGRCAQHRDWFVGQGTLFEDGGVTARPAGPWRLYTVGKGLCAHCELPGGYHVLQASDLRRHATAEDFLRSLLVPTVEAGVITGRAANGDRVTVDQETMAVSINGKPRPHPPAMLHDSPQLESRYGSGRITIRAGSSAVTYDAGDYGA